MKTYRINGLSIRQIANNVIKTYRTAAIDQKLIADGLLWYKRANQIAQQLADDNGVGVEVAAGVIAALSPQCSWSLNIKLANEFMKTGDCGHLGACKRKAAKIVNGEDPLNVLGGLKTLNFYGNILDPSDGDSITIDRHAIRIGGIDKTSVTPKQYSAIKQAYAMAAKEIGLIGQQVQAVTWCIWRGTAE